MDRRHQARSTGFTMIELVVVMAMLGLLLGLALPQYMAALDRGREQVLQQNLTTMREAIDKFYGDRGRYPDKLEDLVTHRYLRAIPADPFTEAATWVVVAPKELEKGGVIDIRSTGQDRNGQPRLAPAFAGGAHEPVGLVDMVSQEGGSSRVVSVQSAASSPETGVRP
jgi:general secretion pathway protein G